MASSSSSKPHHIFQTKVLNGHDAQQVDEKAKAEEKDLLELRLGRGGALTCKNLHTGSSSSSSCSYFPSSKQPKQQHIGLDLGLGLGCCRSTNSTHQQTSISPDHLDRPSYRAAERDHAMPCSVPAVPSPMPFRLRPQPGLWFALRSSPNRKREMSLPQIPKMYIRVKDDEKVTVLMVKTYLVTKLGLSNEAQIEILCKGQRLTSSQMLKHVRDTIWLQGLMESLIESGGNTTISVPNGAPVNHFMMCLDYERKC